MHRKLARIALLALCCNACIYARLMYFNTPTLSAPSYFDSRIVRASTTPLPLSRAPSEAVFRVTRSRHATYESFDELLRANQTRAFLAIRDGLIVYERYFGDVSENTMLPSFSISKTYAALSIGCAVNDGLLGSMDDPITKYLPDLARKSGYREVTLDHLLRMTSGIYFDEESTAAAMFYYSTDLSQRTYAYDVRWPPGTHYLYGSVNIQLLWQALHARLGGDTVSHYFQERVWGPLGAEHAATWSLDSRASGVEKFFGGFNATARDHARIGLLFLNGGTLGGRVIVPRSWIARSLSPDPVAGLVSTADGRVRRGMYQWFLTVDGSGYFAKGYRGQYIFVVPGRNMVFVRFGESYGDVDWPSLFVRIADGYQAAS